MLSFFPRGVLDEILNLIESVSEEFPSYSWVLRKAGITMKSESDTVFAVLNLFRRLAYIFAYAGYLRRTLIF